MNPTLQLLKFLLLVHFPSASSIACYDEKFYLTGDDARHILILDSGYQTIDSIVLFNHPEIRIPKSEKADFEASTVLPIDNKPHLLIFGSASGKERKRIMLIPLLGNEPYLKRSYDKEFISQVRNLGIKPLNLEGVTSTGEQLILANRGSQSFPENHLIITSGYFWEKNNSSIRSIRLLMPHVTTGFNGVSEISYLKSNDMLLLTFSTENTKDNYKDGAIGDSYIGWIRNFSGKLNSSEIKLDGLINLAEEDKVFKNQKIEGICVEFFTGDTYILHLVSDNDQGMSHVFQIRLKLKN
ncbi:MAG TPA: hypothetical protein VGK59_04210 [Ohtaekwangia sp.]